MNNSVIQIIHNEDTEFFSIHNVAMIKVYIFPLQSLWYYIVYLLSVTNVYSDANCDFILKTGDRIAKWDQFLT